MLEAIEIHQIQLLSILMHFMTEKLFSGNSSAEHDWALSVP
jgi:hypothetical protein